MFHGEGIHKIQLLTGYSNGTNGKWLKAKSICGLKSEIEKTRLELIREEISRLNENSLLVIRREKEKHLLHWELIIERYYDVNLPDQLRVIDESSEKKWSSEIHPNSIQYRTSGKPMYSYAGFLNYTQYKYALRKLEGTKQADIVLYEMRKMGRSKLVKELVQNIWDQAIVELEKENGKILTNKYLIVNEIEELVGLFSCEKGEVFLRSLPTYSILDSPYQLIQARR